MKELIKMVITHFFVITVAVLFFTTLSNTIDGVEEYPIFFIWQVFITGIVSALPSIIFYSKKELTKRQWKLRYVIHFILIESIILTEGRIFNWYSNFLSALVIVLIVVFVYIVVFTYSYFIDFNDAQKVNSALRTFNKDEEEKENKDI
ncbi:MAG: DUF3021 family protein [Oscillospiraceae bacterium]|nr:DUF3021 family protein [Oscillospiraceae bacterium]